MACKRPDVAVDQDPDYENIAVHQAKRIKLLEKDAKEASVKKIANIIKSQFASAIAEKRYEIDVTDQRLHQAHMMLDRLRAYIVASYYSTEEKFSKEMGRALAYQNSLHPAVKELLLGKRPRSFPSTATQATSLQSTPCGSSSTTRPSSTATTSGHSSVTYGSPEFPAALASSSSADSSLRAVSAPVSPDVSRASRFKTKKRIIVGNVSRYIPMDKREENDQSTHKWMVYVRGPKEEPVLDHFVKKVWFFLHPSYRPNDLVEISQPPFHLTRRGWGEFPVRVQLHFHDPRNKRIDIIHKLKLDKTYTGLQTLGSETVVDILVYKAAESASRTSSNLQTGLDQPSDFNVSNCTVTAATISAPARRNLLLHERTSEHMIPEVEKSCAAGDHSIIISHIKTEPSDSDQCDDDLQSIEHGTLNLKSNDGHSSANKSPLQPRTSQLSVPNSPQLKITNVTTLSPSTFSPGPDYSQKSSVVQSSGTSDVGSSDPFSLFPSPTKTTPISLTQNTTSNVRVNASLGTQTVLSVIGAKAGEPPALSTTFTAVPRQSKLDGVSVLQKSLLNTNHVVNQVNSPAQGPLRILQGDAFTKPVLIVPKAAKSASTCGADVKTATSCSSPSLLSSAYIKPTISTIPPTTPLLIIPTLPKSSPKVSTTNNSLSPSLKTQLSSPPLHTISSLCSDSQTKAPKPLGSNSLQAGVSLIKSPNSSVTAPSASAANPSTATNNFYIKCVDKHGNIFLVPVASANNVKPRTPNAPTTQACSQAATVTTPPPLNNKLVPSCPSAQPSALPTYLLQLVPSKPGASVQAQLVRLPLPNATTPSSTTPKSLCRTSNASAVALSHSLSTNKSSTSGTPSSSAIQAEVTQQSPRIVINIDELHSMAAILKSFVKQFPITTPNPDRTQHPYCAPSPETFLSWYIGKQRASEWQRAKAIRNAMLEAFSQSRKWSEKKVWSTKEILWWCRRYGHTPVKPVAPESQGHVLSVNDALNTYTEAKDLITSLEERHNQLKNDIGINLDDDLEVDILTIEEKSKPNSASKELNPDPRPLLRLLGPSDAQLINSEAASIGVKFQPIEIRPGVVASLAEMMILAASKLFIEDILREGLAKGFQRLGGNRCPNTITVDDIHTGLESLPECDFLTNKYLGKGIVKCIAKDDT